MANYRVLWFDDKHQEYEFNKSIAKLEDIQLVCFDNAKEGLAEIENPEVNAIILDGLFFVSEENKNDTPDDDAFAQVAKKINNLKAQGKIIPWFIYSGQTSFVKDKNKLVELFKDDAFAHGKVFDKSNPNDFKELCQEIKKAVDCQPITQARHNNPELMQIFEKGYLGQDEEDQLLQLLIKPLPKNKSDIKEFLSNIRSIHESCLIKLESISVIPDANARFSQINKHLSGNKRWDSSLNELVPTTQEFQNSAIENLNAWIYFTCGTYIHNLKQQHYAGYMISNYAVESLRQGLLEILLWFKKTYEENK